MDVIGFYLYYLFLAVILGVILCMPAVLSGKININNYTDYAPLTEFAAYFSCIYCAIISGILLTKKKLWNNLGYVLLAFLGIFIATSTGLFLGLMIPAFLTTKAPGSVEQKK